MSENKRVQLSKKIRFDVFKRDMFCCQYCGQGTPKVILEVDHIIPVVNGGKNNIDNLMTACFDCNRGKGKHELTVLPENTASKIEILKEKELQYKEYQKILNKIDKRINADIDKVAEAFSKVYEYRELSEHFKNTSVKNFISKLGVIDVVDSMNKACGIMDFSDDAVKYFCGICWNKINNR